MCFFLHNPLPSIPRLFRCRRSSKKFSTHCVYSDFFWLVKTSLVLAMERCQNTKNSWKKFQKIQFFLTTLYKHPPGFQATLKAAMVIIPNSILLANTIFSIYMNGFTLIECLYLCISTFVVWSVQKVFFLKISAFYLFFYTAIGLIMRKYVLHYIRVLYKCIYTHMYTMLSVLLCITVAFNCHDLRINSWL